jgi:hypothetical protein
MSGALGSRQENTHALRGATVTLYRLESTLSAEGSIFDLFDPKGRIASFFIWGEGDDKQFRFSKPKAVAQQPITLQAILKSDYLTANIGVPLFSEKARSVLSAHIPDELQFYECVVQCQGQQTTFFLGKTLRYMPLVDQQQSEFRTLTGGEKILSKAAFREDTANQFFIARDVEFQERLVVSQKFVDLCRFERLNVEFSEPI